MPTLLRADLLWCDRSFEMLVKEGFKGLACQLRGDFKDSRAMARGTLDDMKAVVESLPRLNAAKASLTTHLRLAACINSVADDGSLAAIWAMESDILAKQGRVRCRVEFQGALPLVADTAPLHPQPDWQNSWLLRRLFERPVVRCVGVTFDSDGSSLPVGVQPSRRWLFLYGSRVQRP